LSEYRHTSFSSYPFSLRCQNLGTRWLRKEEVGCDVERLGDVEKGIDPFFAYPNTLR
jgi:hypothetical protein